MTLTQNIKRLEPYLIGIWRFRIKGEPRQWACTYTLNGYYYDIYPQKTLQKALNLTWKSIKNNCK